MTPAPERLICLSEDRPGAEVHLELTLLGLERFEPGSRVVLHRPNPTDEVRRWPSRFSFLTLVEEIPAGASGWDCKPHVLLRHLMAGTREAIWLDSDLLLLKPLAGVLSELSPDSLVIAQEPRRANHGEYSAHARARAWGFDVAREIPGTLNTCFLRVTDQHVALLSAWRELLADEQYRRQAALPRDQRADCFVGDQDSLNALLVTRPWANIPVRVLETGRDLVQSAGPLTFTLRDRWRCAFGPGPLGVHAIDVKPWAHLAPARSGNSSRLLRLFAETSPYTHVARSYVSRANPAHSGWMNQRSLAGTLLRLLSFGRLSLQGVLPTLAATCVAAISPQRARPKSAGQTMRPRQPIA